MISLMKYLWLITAVAALAVSPVFAQFYEYKDKNGNTVITDRPTRGCRVPGKGDQGGACLPVDQVGKRLSC